MEGLIKDNEMSQQTFQIELSFVEMEIIMKAMQAYDKTGYGLRNSTLVSKSHVDAANDLHDELIELYSTSN